MKKVKTKLIAELGTLHMSSFQVQLDAVKASFDAGADLVKLQLINPESAWWASSLQKKRYQEIDWSPFKWEDFFTQCQKEFKDRVFASLFDTSFLSLDYLMPIWKLGWKANSTPDLIERVFESGVKPIFWSMNGTEYWRNGLNAQPVEGFDRESSVARRLEAHSLEDRTKRFYVQTVYPIPDELKIIPKFGTNYHGLSYHSNDLPFIGAAILAGAQYVEVHCYAKGASGPDTTFALSMKDLKNLSKLRDKLCQSIPV